MRVRLLLWLSSISDRSEGTRMLAVTSDDVVRMKDALFFEGEQRRRKFSKFWTLLPLAAVIATAGITSNSTATVIGAMIVAPLMTPILGTALAIVLADRRNVLRSVLMVLAGALLVIVMGYLLGLLSPVPEVAATNEQVAQRVDPHLVDLIAALATGAVGAFALVRSDISDTLPGVAIAISLVPPLAVVGLTLESGAPAQAAGALLLFGTNVASIIAMGTVVLLAYRVRTTAAASGQDVGGLSRLSLVVVGAFVLLMAVPLGVSGVQLYRQTAVVAEATPIAQRWAERQAWQITDVQFRAGDLWVTAAGPAPNIDPASLRRDLTAAGLGDVALEVQLLDGGIQQVPPS
jgi:uncharacterized hydrophobic protein (TIGR00271 family)